MKFSSSLKFNAVSEWWDEYIAYDALKKYIYQFEKQQGLSGLSGGNNVDLSASFNTLGPDHDLEANESSALLGGSTPGLLSGNGGAFNDLHSASGSDALFIPLLNKELKKIVLFYEVQERDLLAELEELREEVRKREERGLYAEGYYDEDPNEEEDDDDFDEDDDLAVVGEEDEFAEGRDEVGRVVHVQEPTSSSAGGTWGRRRRVSSSVSAGPSRRRRSSEHNTSPTRTRRYSVSSSSSDHPAGAAGVGGGGGQEDLTSSILSSTKSTTNLKSPLIRSIASALPFIHHHTPSPTLSSPSHSRHPSSAFPTSSYPTTGPTIWRSSTPYITDTRLLYKRRLTTLFIHLSSLQSYVTLNHTAFRKILKKYDKITYSSLLPSYLHGVVEPSLPWMEESKSRLSGAIEGVVGLYARCVLGDESAKGVSRARRELGAGVRENVAWERDTIWRQMIGAERRGELHSLSLNTGAPLGAGLDPGAVGGMRALGGSLVVEQADVGKVTRIAGVRLTKKKLFALIAVGIFVALLNLQTVPVDGGGKEANRCFAVLVFCTVLWATEAIPLFVTSLLVPLLLVTFRIIRDEGTGLALSAPGATKFIFSTMFSPTIMLLIGGFTISSALSKTNIDRVLITRVLSMAGGEPRRVLLAVMGVACFASMWISNVAAPMLCFTLVRPILRNLPPKSSFAPCLILGIALAANIGGQSSPISSPQNLIALQAMDPPLDWARWFAVAIPVSAISIVLIWLLLLVSYKPAQSPDGEGEIEIKTIRPTKERFTVKQWWVSFVCLLTIGLWCVEHEIEEWVGDMGVIAILPVVLFFGTGVLKKDDFEQFAWTIVFLAMGGIALGKGVMSSGLLEVMDVVIRNLVSGLSLYTVVLVLTPVVLVVSTFISHTIASVLLVPIAKEVGSNLGNHANLLIFITGLICSTGMGMPVSGFPNQTAATQEDDLGQLYLSNVDFLKNGVPASIIATMVVSTVGFVLMKAIGL